MITQKKYNEMAELVKLTACTPNQGKRIAHYYNEFISRAKICTTCPESLNNAFTSLKQWFFKNESILLNNLNNQQLKKKEVVIVNAKVDNNKFTSTADGTYYEFDDKMKRYKKIEVSNGVAREKIIAKRLVPEEIIEELKKNR